MSIVQDLSDIDVAQQMREGMRRLASGVSVVTANDLNGERYAMTASSVTSVSDAPPSLLVCVHTAARIDEVIKESQLLAVNVLAHNQQAISEMCASPDTAESRFETGVWEQDKDSGLHFLLEAEAVFICKVSQTVTYGTHNIYICDIEHVKANRAQVSPLIYLNGSYRSVSR